MSSLATSSKSLPDTACSQVETCLSAQGLDAIKDEHKQLVIWRRALPRSLSQWLEQLPYRVLPDVQLLVQPRALRSALSPELDASGMPGGDLRNLLLGDIDSLVSQFSRITQSDRVDVRLKRVCRDGCWKFHRDAVTARLLVTYRGPATQWVQPIHAKQALREQKQYTGPLEQFRRDDVTIFKGSSAGPDSGIVHRSPPIADTGHTRLLLTLNTP